MCNPEQDLIFGISSGMGLLRVRERVREAVEERDGTGLFKSKFRAGLVQRRVFVVGVKFELVYKAWDGRFESVWTHAKEVKEEIVIFADGRK